MNMLGNYVMQDISIKYTWSTKSPQSDYNPRKSTWKTGIKLATKCQNHPIMPFARVCSFCFALGPDIPAEREWQSANNLGEIVMPSGNFWQLFFINSSSYIRIILTNVLTHLSLIWSKLLGLLLTREVHGITLLRGSTTLGVWEVASFNNCGHIRSDVTVFPSGNGS